MQSRLRLTDGVLLGQDRGTRQEDVQVGRGHVELYGLVGPGELELGDLLLGDRLVITSRAPAKIVDRPEDFQGFLKIAVFPGEGIGHNKSCRAGGSWPLIIRG